MSCPDCFTGSVHTGEPKGNITKLHGLDAYVAEPPAGQPVKGIIIIIPDVFGWKFPNNRLLADRYAQKGSYKVYLPEFMNGYGAPTWSANTMATFLRKAPTFWGWITKPFLIPQLIYAVAPFIYHCGFSKSWPIVRDFFIAVRQNEGAELPVGAAGFCWGGKYTVILAHGAEVDGKQLIDAGFTGHPSRLVIPDEIEKIKIPVSFALADHDNVLPMDQVGQLKSVIEEHPEKGETKIYVNAGHGFCVRADLAFEESEKQAREAEDQAIDFFNRQFARFGK